MLVEIAVQDLQGARVAAAAGADRVELCAALGTGGLTPSAGLIRAVVALGIPTRVLIRCREGGFSYPDSEIALMGDDIRTARELGAAGVVVGAAGFVVGTAERGRNRLDRSALDHFVAAAQGLVTVLHRVSDLVGVDETAAALEDCGIDQVLTSGGAPSVGAGLPGLGLLAERLGGERVIAGGGARAADVPELARLGIGAVHASAAVAVPAEAGEQTGPGAAPGRTSTAPDRVAALVDAARAVRR